MTFLTILGVTEIFCSFKLVLVEEKTDKEIPESSRLDFAEKFSGNYFALSPSNREAIADLPLLRTLLAICQKCWQPSFSEVMDFFLLLAYASLAASRIAITSLSELYFRIRKFSLLIQTKKVSSMNYGSSTSSWKPWRWVKLHLIFYTRDIYSQNSWKIHIFKNLRIAFIPCLWLLKRWFLWHLLMSD